MNPDFSSAISHKDDLAAIESGVCAFQQRGAPGAILVLMMVSGPPLCVLLRGVRPMRANSWLGSQDSTAAVTLR
jgi:hypothetical protein